MVAALVFSSAHARQSYFINHEVEYNTLTNFPKWTGVLSRYFKDAKPLEPPCGPSTYNPCKLKEWNDFLDSQRSKTLSEQVESVNSYINRSAYILDINNWGINDYWATPFEFQRRNGDCEDYAIAKYMSLRSLGVPADKLRVVILQDLNLGIMHAVLIVFVGSDVMVLDNQSPHVKNALNIYHYKPIYSINEEHWWKHIPIQ